MRPRILHDQPFGLRTKVGRRHRAGPVCALILGFAAVSCGSSGTSPSSSSSTNGTSPVVTTAESTTSSSPSATTTTVPTATLARIWFVRDERLVPAYRSATSPEEIVSALLAGPRSTDSPGLTTSIPSGTALRNVHITGDLATVDMNSQFESGGGSLSMVTRIAQVIFTLTEIDGVKRVSFALDGTPATYIGGEGIDVSSPLGRNDFLGSKPFILASQPLPGQVITSPLRIVGENSTFENNVEISLRTSDGRVLVSTFATGTGPIHDAAGQPVWGPFETSLDFYAGSATTGVLELTETASDGSGQLLADFSIPVTFATTEVKPAPPLSGASTNAVVVPSSGCCSAGPSVLLSKITTQNLAGFDQIVFEFSSPVVNYHVRYVPLPVKQDPSDQVVAVQGDNVLQVSMGATGIDQSANPPHQTYTGPLRIQVGRGSVIELVQSGDFEAVSNWVIGVRGKPTFRVSAEANPARLVIDVASP